jgi:hypothetical protein
MKYFFTSFTDRHSAAQAQPVLRYVSMATLCVTVLLLVAGDDRQAVRSQHQAVAQRKLPSAEKIVDGYLKAIGGKKRVALIRDASCEWIIELNDQPIGRAKTQIKAPGSLKTELTFANGQIISTANSSSAWVLGLDGILRTLTGPEAAAAKLQALLDATHLLYYKKQNVLARVISIGDLASEPTYIVEFSTRGGGRLRYWFSLSSKLLVRVEDEGRKTTTRFADYRTEGPTANVLEPHRVSLSTDGTAQLTFMLQRASYNTGIVESAFDPPRAAEALDVPALLRKVGRNQDEIEKRVTEYAFMQKETDREITGKGEIKKETVKVFEVFPVAHRESIMKLISENGVALSGERAAKEEKHVQEEFLKAERDSEKNKEKAERERAEQKRKNVAKGKAEDDDPELSQFLRACEFISPRRERFRDRDAVVFDFRARPGFKPSNRQESLISKLVGVVWIDPIDKQVMRLEARLAEGFKMAGGLLLSLRPGAGFVMEQTRMAEGVWLPRLAQVNLSVKVLLFGGGDLNKTIEWSDYKHFKGDVGDYKLDAPKIGESTDKKP